MKTPLRVLVVENTEDQAETLMRELRRGGYDPVYQRVQTAEAMKSALAVRAWDLVIADYSAIRFSAPDALTLLQGSAIDLPFIIVSDDMPEDIAISLMTAGAHDYLTTSNLKRLIPSVVRVLHEAEVRLQHKHALGKLRQSEERFRELTEHITEVFWMADRDMHEVLYISPAFEKTWGLRCENLYRNPRLWIEAIHPDDKERVEHAVRTFGPQEEEVEYRIVRPDGAVRWIRARAFPIKDASGQVYRSAGIASDITERKSSENALHRAKDFSETLIRTANVIILSLDCDGNIELFNETAEKITGYTAAELRGRNWFEILVPRERYPHVWEEFLRLKSGDTPRVFENPILTKSGEERHIMWQNNCIKTNDQVIATISFGNDITERRQAEQELKRRNAELKELNLRLEEASDQLLQSEKMAAIGQMAAGVAHEINNPVGYISSNLNILQDYVDRLLRLVDTYGGAEGALGPDTLDALQQLKREIGLDYLKEDIGGLMRESKEGITRVRQIVADLKNFSHVNEEAWHCEDLHRGLESTLNIVQSELKYKAEVIKQYGDLPPVVCRLSQINQVFMNLLVNAAQAIEGRGIIWIRTGADEDWVWVEVEDTGKGIAPEHKNRIFEPFFTTKPIGKGTGLGLSLSYGIIAKHNGRIEVDSAPGKGSRFRIWLPRVQERAPETSGAADEI